ncbi:MAG: c-type cytochrome [Betaproteobacteria bacterium]|nr:c-type cytochrome [Betaproteobacteria bacterium]
MSLRHSPVLLALLAAFSLPASANDAVQAACGRCHGADGVAASAGTPHLNGQHAGYLVESMDAFRAKKRPTAVPEHQAGLKPDDLKAAVELYAGSKSARPKQDTNAEKVARGEAIYGDRCASCHLDNGRDFEQEAPFLAGQDLAYINAQNGLFVSGKRKFAPRQDDAYKGLSAADLEAVSHFFASQDQFAAKGSEGKKKKKAR